MEIAESDLVDVHPLPAKKGMAKQIIARFKDLKLGQRVLILTRSKSLSRWVQNRDIFRLPRQIAIFDICRDRSR